MRVIMEVDQNNILFTATLCFMVYNQSSGIHFYYTKMKKNKY